MAPDPDAALMVAFQSGDETAFRALFEKYGRAMMAFCQRFVREPARAEELAQDVFLKLYRSADRYSPSARFSTFLYRIATNHCLNEVRRGEYRLRPDRDPASDGSDPRDPDSLSGSAATPEEEVHGRALERSVRDLLDRLPEKQRAAFVLARFEGLAYEEIAGVLGTTVPAVKSLVHRATVSAAEALAPWVPPTGAEEGA
ncbi:MAG TPA: sigma-70 family RNA polymerase sigma factor [Anaeromyxobacteraceae bacterium]|nr:sigma-70 family RNA polymerase sigma factor [Anaeromyxobacteraceae bacterium]